jgi:dynein heavy chain
MRELEDLNRDELQARMEKPVFSKGESQEALPPSLAGQDNMIFKKGKGGELESNYDKGLMKTVAEVVYWEKLQNFGILIPSEVHDIANYRDDFRVLKENVLLVVRDYNVIMDNLNDDEKRLFDYHINMLNKKLEPGWRKNIKWNNRGIVDGQLKDWRRQCFDTNERVKTYKRNTDDLGEKFREICEMPFIKLEKKNVYEDGEFEIKQN